MYRWSDSFCQNGREKIIKYLKKKKNPVDPLLHVSFSTGTDSPTDGECVIIIPFSHPNAKKKSRYYQVAVVEDIVAACNNIRYIHVQGV